MTKWKRYTGSYEQIASIKSHFIFRDNNGVECALIKKPCEFIDNNHLKEHLDACQAVEILLIQDDPLRRMKIRQAMTGQPVWWRNKSNHRVSGQCDKLFAPFANPDALEYRFTPFEELNNGRD
jgi:hypothetical protein